MKQGFHRPGLVPASLVLLAGLAATSAAAPQPSGRFGPDMRDDRPSAASSPNAGHSGPAHPRSVRYTVTEIPPLPGTTRSFVDLKPTELNEFGQVAGYSANAGPLIDEQAFTWRDGQQTALPGLPGADHTAALGLNNRGQVVGVSGPVGFLQVHALLWEGGRRTDLGVYPGDTFSVALSTNDWGQIIGYGGYQSTDLFQRALVWDHGVLQDLGGLPGATFSAAIGINEAGQIVGQSGRPDSPHPVLWSDRDVVDLGTFGGAAGFAQDINNRGQIVGGAQAADGWDHPFIWQNSQLTDLLPVNLLAGIAYGINDGSQITGAVLTPEGEIDAALWDRSGMINLNDAVPADSGWQLQLAGAINERGVIVGNGLHNGLQRAFLLTPQ